MLSENVLPTTIYQQREKPMNRGINHKNSYISATSVVSNSVEKIHDIYLFDENSNSLNLNEGKGICPVLVSQ